LHSASSWHGASRLRLFVRLVDELGSTWSAKSRRRVDALKKKEKKEEKEKMEEVVEDIRAT